MANEETENIFKEYIKILKDKKIENYTNNFGGDFYLSFHLDGLGFNFIKHKNKALSAFYSIYLGNKHKCFKEHIDNISPEKLELFLDNYNAYKKEKETIYEQFKAKKYALKKQEDRAMDKLRNKFSKTIKTKVGNRYV